MEPREAVSGYPDRRHAWAVLAILIATAILSYTDRQALSLLVDPIRAELGISDTEISLLLGTAFAVVYGIAGIPLGYLADRWSRRNLIAGGVALWSLGTVACGLSHSFSALFACRIVVGLGEAALSPAAISLISDYFPPARRGVAVGAFLSGIAIGIGASILIGGGVLHLVQSGFLDGSIAAAESPWRLVLLLIGSPGLLWSLVILVIREPRRQASEPTADLSGGAISWARLVPIYLVVAMASLVDNAVGAWAPSLLIRRFGVDPATIGVQLGFVLAVGYGGGVFSGGVLADRAGLKGGWRGKLGLCLAASVLILLAAMFLNDGRYSLALIAVAVYFALSGAVTAAGFSVILDLVPGRSRGLAMAVSFFLNVALGAGLGPTAVALASDHLFGADAGLGPALVATVSAGYLAAAVAALVALRRRSQ